MLLDDSNKIPLDYIIIYILAAIYKISLNDEQCLKTKCNKYYGTEKVLISEYRGRAKSKRAKKRIGFNLNWVVL